MANLTSYSNALDADRRRCRVIIETPKGHRNKFNYDPETRLFRLGGLLPEGMSFPFDFGFIPSTRGGDGDPLDVMLLMDEPAHVGCLVDARIIGVIEAKQTNKGKTRTNHRLLAVPVHSYSHERVRSIKELPASLLAQIEGFFNSYNRLRGKKFRVTARSGPKRAIEIVKQGAKAFEKEDAK